MNMLNVIRGITRPILTLAVVITACILASIITWKTGEVPVWFVGIAASISSYWFSDRGKQEQNDKDHITL